MPKTFQEQKREILEKGMRAMLEETSIPQRMHLQMMKTFKEQIASYKSSLEENNAARRTESALHKSELKRVSEFCDQVSDVVSSMEEEVERLTRIEHLKGEKGDSVTLEEVLDAIKPFLPKKEQIDYPAIIAGVLEVLPDSKEREAEDFELDTEALFEAFVERIQKEKLIDVSHLRNSESFMFGGKRYQFAELMRGAGGTTSGGANVTTQYLLAAVQVGSDITIDLTQLTNWATFTQLIGVYRNNIPQTEGASYNFTLAGSTVTIFNADASEIFNITYSFT